MAIRNEKNFYSGLFFTIVGCAFAIGARKYPFGTGGDMGPGYFPIVLGCLMAFIGVGLSISALLDRTTDPAQHRIGTLAWRPMLLIIGANFAFGILLGGLPSIGLPSFGLVTAIFTLVMISYGGEGHFKLKDSLLLATVLFGGSYLIFIVLLKLQLRIWPTFLVN